MAATIESTIYMGLSIPSKPFGGIGDWKHLVYLGLHASEVPGIRYYTSALLEARTR